MESSEYFFCSCTRVTIGLGLPLCFMKRLRNLCPYSPLKYCYSQVSSELCGTTMPKTPTSSCVQIPDPPLVRALRSPHAAYSKEVAEYGCMNSSVRHQFTFHGLHHLERESFILSRGENMRSIFSPRTLLSQIGRSHLG